MRILQKNSLVHENGQVLIKTHNISSLWNAKLKKNCRKIKCWFFMKIDLLYLKRNRRYFINFELFFNFADGIRKRTLKI